MRCSNRSKQGFKTIAILIMAKVCMNTEGLYDLITNRKDASATHAAQQTTQRAVQEAQQAANAHIEAEVQRRLAAAQNQSQDEVM